MPTSHILAATLAFLGAAPAARAADWVSTQGEVTYHLVHKLHHVDGTSTKVQAIARIDDAGLKVEARAAVASFDSGNANRDAHMLEVVDAAKYPLVVVKGVAPGFVVPASGKADVRLRGEVDLHGVKTPVPIEAQVEHAPDGRVTVTFELATKLTAHDIQRPSLLFVPVDDDLGVTGTLTMEKR